MIWFLPLFSVVLGGLVGSFLAELVIWVTKYLDKQSAKKHIQEQKRQKFPPELDKMIKDNLEKENYNKMDIGLGSMLESSNSPIYRVPARDEMINILVNEHRCDRVRLENMTDKKLETLYGELRGVKESNYIPSHTLFTRDEMINILVNEHQSDRVRLENMTDKKLETIYNVLRGANEKIVNKQAIIDILVNRHGYQEEWLVNKSIDKLQAMYEELKGTSYTPNIKEVDWILEDEESRKIFAGKYYNGEVVSMEEIQAQEIDPELQWELDNKEIVIL